MTQTRKLGLTLLAVLVFTPPAACAQDDAQPLDLALLDQAAVRDTLGTWIIRDESGRKKCRVKLRREIVIGGYRVDVNPMCFKPFPVMENVTSWRLLEGWQIALVDPLRKEILRFYTPDDRCISNKEIDGIFAIDKQ